MKKYLSLFFLVIATISNVSAQKKLRPTFAVGLDVSTGKDLSHVFSSGTHVNISLPIKTYRQLSVGPAVNFVRSAKDYNQAAREIYINLGIGALAEYEVKLAESFSFCGGVRVMYEHVTDDFRAREGYTGSVDVFDGNGMGTSLTAALYYHHFMLFASYNYRKHSVQYDKEFISSFTRHNGNYQIFYFPGNPKLDLSSISISLAYRL